MPAGIRDLAATARRDTARQDAVAGGVLGVEAVPDGLAMGLLAGVAPVAGLYGYLFGMLGGLLFTGAAFMTVEGTAAIAMLVSDVDLGSDDPARSLFTLSILAGVIMILAGVFRLATVLRFVSNSVVRGFITAVGVNIVIGQLPALTGYDAEGSSRLLRTLDLATHLWRIDVPTTLVGVTTIALIVILQRTRLRGLGLVIAVVAGGVLAALFEAGGAEIATVGEIVTIPRSLPAPELPLWEAIPGLLVPAASIAFVGLVQGAAISAGFPNPDGRYANASDDFVGQGAGNVLSGLFQGMPVGGSMSATSLLVRAGARTRLALVVAVVVMAAVILAFGPAVDHLPMTGLAGVLIVAGVSIIKPHEIETVARAGVVQLTVMVITFVLTLLIPLQYAVLIGVGLSILLFVVRQSTKLQTKQVLLADDGRMREIDPPRDVPSHEVVVLQPYGSMFFATAKMLEEQMPDVTPRSVSTVVILRLRGVEEVGATLIDVLRRYTTALERVHSKLVVVTDNPRLHRQLEVTGLIDRIGEENFYMGTEWVGEALRKAYADAQAWVERTSP